MSKDSNGWLSELKEGDEVILTVSQYGATERKLRRVIRVTPKQVKVFIPTSGSGIVYAFRRDNGNAIGRERFGPYRTLEPATPEARAAVERTTWRIATIDRLKSTYWQDCSDETLRNVLNALTSEQQNESIPSMNVENNRDGA